MYFKIGPRYKRYRCYVHFPKFGCKDLYRLTVVSKMDLNFVRAKYSFHKSEVLLLDVSLTFLVSDKRTVTDIFNTGASLAIMYSISNFINSPQTLHRPIFLKV